MSEKDFDIEVDEDQMQDDEFNIQPRNYLTESIIWAAKQEYVNAMYIMGIFFLGHYKCTPDHRKAFHWFKHSAMLNHKDAAYQVAYCYENGIGIESSRNEALSWYHEASRRGNYLAQKRLAFCYSAGKLGCYPDINNADKFHNLYMENPKRSFYENKEKWDIPKELIEAGYTIESEIFKSEEDLIDSLKWAVENDNMNAKYCLALMYTTGFGGDEVLPKDDIKAVELFQELVDDYKHPDSMYCLARMYEEGKGDLPQKLDVALKLYKEAARNGEMDAKQVLNDLKCMPMDNESRALKNEVKKYREIEMVKQQEELDYRRRHSVMNKVKYALKFLK